MENKLEQQANSRNGWKILLIIFCALVGGFLLSFMGFGILWSGIPWIIQIFMFLPFMLLSYAVFRWSNGSLSICVFILFGAAPLGVLMTQFRDTNGSHLMPTLMVLSWIIGILAGCYLGKLFHSLPTAVPAKNTVSSNDL